MDPGDTAWENGLKPFWVGCKYRFLKSIHVFFHCVHFPGTFWKPSMASVYETWMGLMFRPGSQPLGSLLCLHKHSHITENPKSVVLLIPSTLVEGCLTYGTSSWWQKNVRADVRKPGRWEVIFSLLTTVCVWVCERRHVCIVGMCAYVCVSNVCIYVVDACMYMNVSMCTHICECMSVCMSCVNECVWMCAYAIHMCIVGMYVCMRECVCMCVLSIHKCVSMCSQMHACVSRVLMCEWIVWCVCTHVRVCECVYLVYMYALLECVRIMHVWMCAVSICMCVRETRREQRMPLFLPPHWTAPVPTRSAH